MTSPRPVGLPILEVEGLKKYFPVRRGLLRRRIAQIKAVDGVLVRPSRR